MKKIIYDIGSNNGDDIPYYLLRADLVVAVEANPMLCELITERFHAEIENRRLIVENCVITAEEEDEDVSFYIHKRNHVLSQFPEPMLEQMNNYEKVFLPSKSVDRIIKEHGNPYYIKIDIEHYDAQILRSLSTEDIYPPFISAESHSIEIFSLLVSMGYRAFKLVDGSTVSQVYANRIIQCGQEKISYSFPFHSAGPFGNDVDGKWMNAENFFRLLAFEGLGWKDIHASRIEQADSSISPSYKILLHSGNISQIEN